MTNQPEPEPSRPTTSFGAPDLGVDWAWKWGQPASWQAFGQDTSGHGPGCPDCATTDPTSEGELQ